MTKTCTKCGDSKELSFFYKDKNAKDGHRNQCKGCKKAYTKKWHRENLEKRRKINRKYYQENAERKAEYAKKYYQGNCIDYVERNKKWRRDNPEKLKVILSNSKATRRARKEKNGSCKVTSKDLSKLYKQPCSFCGEYGNIHADHIIPISRGGRHSVGNLQPLCRSCNARKSDKFMIEFKRESYGGSADKFL